MLINEDLSTEDDEGKLSTVVKVKNKINCEHEKYQAQGVETMGDFLKSYKKPDNLNDIDVHLLRGIYELQPEENIQHSDEDENGGNKFGFLRLKTIGGRHQLKLDLSNAKKETSNASKNEPSSSFRTDSNVDKSFFFVSRRNSEADQPSS